MIVFQLELENANPQEQYGNMKMELKQWGKNCKTLVRVNKLNRDHEEHVASFREGRNKKRI